MEKAVVGRDKLSEYLLGKVGFEPWPEQAEILRCKKRFVLVAGGEQAGKSMLGSKFLLGRIPEDMIENEGGLLYWLVAADYGRTKAEFEYLVEDLEALLGAKNVRSTKRVDPGSIEVAFGVGRGGGIRIETKSASDPRRLAMRAPNGIVGCEASQLDLDTYQRIDGRVGPKRGWVFLSGTFEESLGWYPQLWQAWKSGADDRQSFSLPTWANRTLYPGGRKDPEIERLERDSSDAFFKERIEGVPVPPKGLVFGEFRADLHVRELNWEVGEPIYLWEDPGYGSESAHAIEVVQIVGEQVRVIDEIYERGLITRDIIEIVKARPWWKDVKWLVSDPSYKDQHHSMTSVAEEWLGKTGLYAGGEKVRINEGTERLKGFLKPDPVYREPKIVFSPRCKGILSEFGAGPNPFDGQTRVYRWKTDREGVIVGEVPEDKWNHGIKAVIYGLVDKYGYGRVGGRDRFIMKRW